ncbi:phosphate ABC transporter substrate-binding protein [Rheinheimera baltica]|uniref:Phosphate ABC transporter substrate-binding protein n=1 Tax=Rheinheimera baltica TaxID=67576 RepID=A0ABT9HXA5_9GAMM|nr:phosphate ABC transporter substrate-binding protein [Rheinheimera baltica]MDP5135755.1 phosphate ABC transporter substrate-binding protein [Rheinheimera baltica]MDP5142368.1 phosphate ABC transporter substrate-binding protein [Rheinheimera baltica]MDP5150730.1 phosphate ABC transporter substrate-binding protein [Rheinheimera baltica]MDP5191269.1 phosphate ABC transporter substrate-binding protein [Rheinheimera baltica]
MKKLTLFLATTSMMCFSTIAQVVVVVNPAMNETITNDEIARIYTGRSSALTPVNLRDSDTKRAIFDEKAVGRSSSQLKAYWSKLVFTGKGNPPKELASDADVVSFVGSNEYAIGYIDAANVTDQVKVIHTIN